MDQQININLEEAKALRVEIEMEFAEVKQILTKVHEACSADPVEDDDNLKAIADAGQKLEETWGQLEDVFKEAMDQLEEGIRILANWLKERKEDVERFVSKIHN